MSQKFDNESGNRRLTIATPISAAPIASALPGAAPIGAATVRERLCGATLTSRRRNQRGLTLIELIVAFTIMITLSAMAVPLARSKVRAERERELRYDERDMRLAIDKYKDMCDAGYFGQIKAGTDCFPESLEVLVEGVKLPGPDGKKLKLLRKIPIDPFTRTADWGLRSDQDDPKSQSWGGQNVFEVYSKTTEKAPDGSNYSEW